MIFFTIFIGLCLRLQPDKPGTESGKRKSDSEGQRQTGKSKRGRKADSDVIDRDKILQLVEEETDVSLSLLSCASKTIL